SLAEISILLLPKPKSELRTKRGGVIVVKVLRYKPKSRGFKSRNDLCVPMIVPRLTDRRKHYFHEHSTKLPTVCYAPRLLSPCVTEKILQHLDLKYSIWIIENKKNIKYEITLI
ncbi:hypothetical protein L9F63_010394, partial [Diploptera punctata]